MTKRYFRLGLPGETSGRGETVRTLRRDDDPALYLPAPGLREAVDSALILGRPLLLMGPPGTGKSELAFAIASWFGWRIEVFETKSTSEARDLFYSFAALPAFYASNLARALPPPVAIVGGPGLAQRDGIDLRRFIRYQALGKAILQAYPPDNPRVRALVGDQQSDGEEATDLPITGPARTVVLIDEIDKAPRDFPNDLLNEIERLYFRVPELHNRLSPGGRHDPIPADYTPVVVITSNDERGLPQAFLRRCLRFEIAYPAIEDLKKIVARRLAAQLVRDKDAELPVGIADLVEFFMKYRSSGGAMTGESASTAELLDWLTVLLFAGYRADVPLAAQKALLAQSVSVLAKSADAVQRLKQLLRTEFELDLDVPLTG